MPGSTKTHGKSMDARVAVQSRGQWPPFKQISTGVLSFSPVLRCSKHSDITAWPPMHQALLSFERAAISIRKTCRIKTKQGKCPCPVIGEVGIVIAKLLSIVQAYIPLAWGEVITLSTAGWTYVEVETSAERPYAAI